MSKQPNVPLSAGLITVRKGEAAPVAARPREEPGLKLVEPAAAQPATPPAKKPVPDDEPLVHHNFRVKKSFKRAFDQAAFDVEMKNVEFLQHIFEVYQKHMKG